MPATVKKTAVSKEVPVQTAAEHGESNKRALFIVKDRIGGLEVVYALGRFLMSVNSSYRNL